jgi:CPA1 family monovalent cation:H+ antiporter
VWDAAVFVLNVLAFLLMGLQARAILQRLEGPQLGEALTFAGLVFVIVVVVRLAWVMSYREILQPLVGLLSHAPHMPTNPRLRLLVAWCGMRGILTLATAFSLPADFPGRDIIVLSAFTVVLGTLIVQGSTIGLLIRWLRIPSDISLDADVRAGRALLAKAGLTELADRDDPEAQRLRKELEAAKASSQRRAIRDDDPDPGALRLQVVGAQRRALNAMHHTGEIAEDAFQALQEELDWRELSVAPRGEREISEA